MGPGLFIQHGFSTIVGVESMGSNCWINQQVTVGHTDKGRPKIGNNVKIMTGAKVLGNVTIGDNVIIGAGAIIVKDVPSDCVVVGSRAYIVKRNGKKSQRRTLNINNSKNASSVQFTLRMRIILLIFAILFISSKKAAANCSRQ